jgi:hypothetical protein
VRKHRQKKSGYGNTCNPEKANASQCNPEKAHAEADAIKQDAEARTNSNARAPEPDESIFDSPKTDSGVTKLAIQGDSTLNPKTDAQKWPYVQAEAWAVHLRTKARVKIGPQNWSTWKALMDDLFKGDHVALGSFAGMLDAEKRWPDHLEAEYRKRRPDAIAETQGRKVVIL